MIDQRNQKKYKVNCVRNNTLSPRYLFGHAGFYFFGGFLYG